jgi:hypothetical protein
MPKCNLRMLPTELLQKIADYVVEPSLNDMVYVVSRKVARENYACVQFRLIHKAKATRHSRRPMARVAGGHMAWIRESMRDMSGPYCVSQYVFQHHHGFDVTWHAYYDGANVERNLHTAIDHWIRTQERIVRVPGEDLSFCIDTDLPARLRMARRILS